MIEAIIQQHPRQVYRIDKFKVPKPARDEFIQKVRITHEFIKTLPGFIQDFVFQQTGGPGEFNFVRGTIKPQRRKISPTVAVARITAILR